MGRKPREDLRQISRECFIVFPYSPSLNWGWAMGRIARIKRGVNYDVVELNVGVGYGKDYTRKFICRNQDTRKQVATLKVGKICQVMCFVPKFKRGEKEMLCQALAFWCAYVPLAFDRMELEKEQETEEFVETLAVEEEQEYEQDFLSTFERKSNDE